MHNAQRSISYTVFFEKSKDGLEILAKTKEIFGPVGVGTTEARALAELRKAVYQNFDEKVESETLKLVTQNHTASEGKTKLDMGESFTRRALLLRTMIRHNLSFTELALASGVSLAEVKDMFKVGETDPWIDGATEEIFQTLESVLMADGWTPFPWGEVNDHTIPTSTKFKPGDLVCQPGLDMVHRIIITPMTHQCVYNGAHYGPAYVAVTIDPKTGKMNTAYGAHVFASDDQNNNLLAYKAGKKK